MKGSHVPLYLGIEAGGTRTVAILAGPDLRCVRRLEAGPANVRLLDDRQLVGHFRAMAKAFPKPAAIAIGMAGARTETDCARIRQAAAKAWPGVRCYATNDLETALLASDGAPKQTVFRPRRIHSTRDGSHNRELPRVLVLSGTGSCCFGRKGNRRTVKVGGWGHILGDKGSGYEIGLRALKAVVHYFDRDGRWPELGRRLLRALQLNEPNDLIAWAQAASKSDVAALAVEVFQAQRKRDRIAGDILQAAANSLARDAASCARRLVARSAPVQFIFAGGVLLRQQQFAKKVGRELKRLWPEASISLARVESVYGALALARMHFPLPVLTDAPGTQSAQRIPELLEEKPGALTPVGDRKSLALSPTEQRHPRSMNLDRLPLREAIALMLREDETIPAALLAESKAIEQGVRRIVHSFRRGGRLFYVGAGTSGRLGVLDASECPPTFHVEPDRVQGIIAGGQRALWEAVEGAEDDAFAGVRAVDFRGVNRRDTVVGIAASGRTPFVWGALREAKRRGATTILLCFNPNLVIPRRDRPALILAPRIGPELLTGSTRLKAGTATKLILNIFTTLAMVRTGKVLGNLMIDVNASNIKLRDRAVRIVRELTGADYDTAAAALLKTHWRIKPACARLGCLRTSV